MHRLTARILDVSNEFHNTNFPIHEIVCVSPPPYYIYWFGRYFPNFHLNRDDGPFFLQCMNVIQGGKSSGRQCNKLLDAVVTILKYKKITIDHYIYIKVLSDVTVSYLKVSIGNVINTNNNEILFSELTILFE